jgi:hypothetical protein
VNFVYLSPSFPPNFQDFIKRLHGLGANVLGLGDTPYAELAPELQASMSEYYKVDDLHNYDQLLRACGFLTHKHGRLDRLDSLQEYWLEVEAKLRTDFNIAGIKTDTIHVVKSKSRMKERYRQFGVPVARGRIVHTFEEGQALAAEIGYPLVAKPDIGVGAAATYRLENEGAMRIFFHDKPAIDYLLEEYIQGTLVSFDGLTDRDGNVLFSASHVFGRGIMETVNEKDHLFYYSERVIPKDLEELGLITVKAFDVRERFFHFEFFRTERGLVALEVNLRPPGGLTANMFCYATDSDIFRQWASVVMHNRLDGEWNRKYHVGYVSRKEHKSYTHDHANVLAHSGALVVHHAPIEPIFRGALGDYGYVLRSPDLEPVLEATRYIQA